MKNSLLFIYSQLVILMISTFLIIFVFAGCKGEHMEVDNDLIKKTQALKLITPGQWEGLSEKRIFFGHQSVGNNMVDGINDLLREYPQIKLNIIETNTENLNDYGTSYFAHDSNLGLNNDPTSKVDAFADHLEHGLLGKKADIAFLKFCFVDVDSETDIQNNFKYYKNKMSILKDQYPDTTFVHFTVPLLRKSKSTLITWIKDLLGRNDSFFDNAHNANRNIMNNLIIQEYEGNEPIFDIAKLESTYPDGTRDKFKYSGRVYYSLVPEFTDDGGHLNEVGRKVIAEQLLVFLARL